MSETPRIYSTGGNGFSFARKQRSQRNRRIVLAAVGVVFVWAFWISRDTHSIAEFVEADRRLELVVPRANVARHRFVESRVWEGIPASWAGGWPEALADTRGLPDWVVGNLAGSGAVAMADDLSNWDDYLVASRMTRVGCLIERALRISPSNSSEWAGGLWIRYWKPGAVYYAVRGRTLLVSPSRDTLVTALTITEERRVAPDVVKQALAEFGGEDARGTVRFSEDEPLGRVFSEVRFAARTEDGEAVVKLRASFREHVSDDLKKYLVGGAAALEPPFDAPVSLSANFGTTVEESWRALAEIAELPGLSAEQWEAWKGGEDVESPQSALTALLGPMGPSVRLAWLGTDLLEMAPTPILVGSIGGSRDSVEAVLETLPGVDAPRVAQARVSYDSESARLEAPLMSGPSMAPVGQWAGDTLFFSTSSAMADAFFDSGRMKTMAAPRPGNVYLRVDPAAAMREIVDVGQELAGDGLLRGYTAETFREATAVGLERATRLESVEILGTVGRDQVELECYVKCAPAGNAD